MGFAGTVTRVKGISDRRRLPRIGRIRLGFKVVKGNAEFPAELPFFMLPVEVAKQYGNKDPMVMVERAKEMGVTRQDVLTFISRHGDRMAEAIEIMLPINEQGAIFPQAYKFYGSSKGIKCIGDGEIAWEDGQQRTCPCERLKTEDNPKGACTLRGSLMCLLPKVNMGGIYQIDVGSYNSVIDVNSGMDYVSSIVGRFAMVPLLLQRIPTVTHHADQKQIHFTLQLLLHPTINIELLNSLRIDTARILETTSHLALEPPRDINPELDTEGIIEGEAVEEGNGNGNKLSEEEQRRELQVAIIQKWTQKGLLTPEEKKGLKAHHATPVEQMPLSELQALVNEIDGLIKAKNTTV
jgi:hypothetical protein